MKESSPLAKVSFSTLIETDDDLRQLRARYSAATTDERICAADFVYNSGLAQDIVGGSFLEFTRRPPGEGAIATLAIFPDFAPALLTVGPIEYQWGGNGVRSKQLTDKLDSKETTKGGQRGQIQTVD